jgi:stage V sporulation protein AB
MKGIMEILRHVISVLIGFGSGAVIAGAVFAFITIIGIVPRLAQKTRTERYIRIYECAIIAGGILGTCIGFFKPTVPLGGGFVAGALMIILGVAIGIFYGCLAMSLAEVLNVIPILFRRMRLQRGMFFIVLAIAVGKMIGSALYFLKPGFYSGQ